MAYTHNWPQMHSNNTTPLDSYLRPCSRNSFKLGRLRVEAALCMLTLDLMDRIDLQAMAGSRTSVTAIQGKLFMSLTDHSMRLAFKAGSNLASRAG
jgi:hypothetical protein